MQATSRPRLADHVLARRHIVDGRERVILHDTRREAVVELGPREWGLLAAADGTRDVAGILLAAARDSDAHAREPALLGFLEQLEAAGMIDVGEAPSTTEEELDEPRSRSKDDDASRPLHALPGFTLACDGSGSCCRLYATVLFGPVEAARARSLMPTVLDADRHERVFTPERGSAPTAGAAVTLRDGRCAYLGADGRCGLHAAAGAAAKPTGCALFPASFIDDGEVVRVSVSVECACVLASAGRSDGAPLLPEGGTLRRDLTPTVIVGKLPATIAMSARSRAEAFSLGETPKPPLEASREAFVAWSKEVGPALEMAEDIPRALLALAARLDGPDATVDLGPSFAALRDRARARAAEDAVWRSARDLARRATLWIERAASLLADDPSVASASPRDAGDERFYVRALLHGHQLAGSRPVAVALRDRAVRMLVARALGTIVAALPDEERDSAAAHPLALVEAMLRGHGLAAYVGDLP